MKNQNSKAFVAFNDLQQITATSTFFRAIEGIRENTMGNDITPREMHALFLLGTRAAYTRCGVTDLKDMTATRFVKEIMKLDVSDTAAEDDVKSLIKKGLVCKEGLKADDETVKVDGRVKVVCLTETGEILYEQIATDIGNLILVCASFIERDGPVPITPFAQVKRFVVDLTKKVTGGLGVAAIAVSLTVNDASADVGLVGQYTLAGLQSTEVEAGVIEPGFNTAQTFRANSLNTLQISREYVVAGPKFYDDGLTIQNGLGDISPHQPEYFLAGPKFYDDGLTMPILASWNNGSVLANPTQ